MCIGAISIITVVVIFQSTTTTYNELIIIITLTTRTYNTYIFILNLIKYYLIM